MVEPIAVTPKEERALEAVDRDFLLDLLDRLVAIPSLGGQEDPAQELVADQLERIGLEVDRWQIDFAELARHPAYCAEIERESGLGVVGRLRGKAPGPGRSLILNGHVDVVPAGDPSNWSHPPFAATRVADAKGERVYGRGALDMKGGLCCAIAAVRALIDAGVELAGDVLIESVIGEEDGGCGTLATILRGYRADGAVVVEPTALAIAPAHAGCLSFRITVPGLSAHGCLRDEGVSAVEKFLPIHEALLAFERHYNAHHDDPLFAGYRTPYALSVGTVQAGNWASSVPESLVCEGRFGLAVADDPAKAREAFERVVRAAARRDPWLRQHPPAVEWWGGQFRPAAVDSTEPIVGAVGEAHRLLCGRKPELRGMTYGADMRLLVHEGNTPTVMYGPGDVRHAHRPDEHVEVADLLQVTRVLALATSRFCGSAS